MSILKSLAVWEKSQRDLENQRRVNLSLENGLATKYKNKVGDDLQNNFEKSKAHKSTLEAAIATVPEKFVKCSSLCYLFIFPRKANLCKYFEI